ncbi:hypothetical protein V7138_11170 [Bacillus sp. JJ1533]|uniref:hypothetical protein n=1 Tax=Bacillus sp. JJ1533 TaxID=3122959 RepID=UPI002FFF0B09
MMYVGVILALALIRWDQKKLHVKTFLIEAIFVCLFVFIWQFIKTFITNKLNKTQEKQRKPSPPLFFVLHDRLFNQRFAAHDNSRQKCRDGVSKGQIEKTKQSGDKQPNQPKE